MKYFLGILMIIHGCIHYLGFAKAFDVFKVESLKSWISKFSGLLWAAAFILFIVTGVMVLMKRQDWWPIALVAVILSQSLIIKYWTDAKYGTIANVIVVIPAIVGFAAWNFEDRFEQDVDESITRSQTVSPGKLKEEAITHLPDPVQKYLRFAGVLDKPDVINFRLIMQGEMRNLSGDWFDFSSEQFNFYDEPERFFFMKADISKLPVYGYHAFRKGDASMLIKALSIIPIIDKGGDQLIQAEMVTVLNDICLFAPGALVDEKITLQPIDSLSSRATFTWNDKSVSADLVFNDRGELVNFISDDRFDINEARKFRFSTPIYAYQEIQGRNLPLYGEAIWHYDDGPFVYGRFDICSISYNVSL